MESKGDRLMEEGEGSLKGFLSFFRDDKSDVARDLFIRAATQYKACGNFTKASMAYKRAADMSKKAKNEGDLVADLEEAAGCCKKAEDMPEAVELYSRVICYHDKNQDYFKAAKVCVSLSEVAEEREAMKWLERASKYYEMQGARVTADQVTLKIAETKARCGDYDGAREVYDRMGRKALDDRVSQASARKIFFMALLAQLATFKSESIMEEVAALRERFEEYQELDTQFNHLTREHMLIQAVIDAIEEESVSKLEEAVADYDNICPLDATKEKMLLRAKTALRHRVDDLR